MQKYYDTVLGSDGSPLVGAQVTVYLTGTTTKATIYTDNGVTQAPNPLTTDLRGMFAFYVADGRYDIKAEKSGFGTLTMSDIQVNEQDTASTIAFTPAGGISANTVAGALIELDGEVAGKASRSGDTFTGSVGIGVSPSFPLDVASGSSGVQSRFKASGGGTANIQSYSNTVEFSSQDASVILGTSWASGSVQFYAGGSLRASIDSAGNFLTLTPSGRGYGNGAGGAVTQGAGSGKATAVTLNKPTGKITMNNASLNAGAYVQFACNNTLVTADDVVAANISPTIGNPENYQLFVFPAGGIIYFGIKNLSGGPLSQEVVINFAITKGATS